MKTIFQGFKQMFPKRSINHNNLLFRALGATLFSFINYQNFKSYQSLEDVKKDFTIKTKIPSPDFQ